MIINTKVVNKLGGLKYFPYICGMKKGASPAQIIEVISGLLNEGHSIKSEKLKNIVKERYNEIYSQSSKDTIIANLREDAMVKFQEDRFIVKLPQDNNKVDLMSVKIENGVVDIRVSQQKGNNSSFNSTSLSKTIDMLSDFIVNDKVRNYFELLPDELNPNINNLSYSVNVVIGMFLAEGKTTKSGKGVDINFISNNDYLRFMGIFNSDIVDLDYWVVKELTSRNHTYDAITICGNFDEIYDKCLNLIENDGNK